MGELVGSSVGGGTSVASILVGEGSAHSISVGVSEEVLQLAQNKISTKITVTDLIHGIFTMNFPFFSYSGNISHDTMDKAVLDLF
jgi:hypothetical protein